MILQNWLDSGQVKGAKIIKARGDKRRKGLAQE